MRPRQAIPVTRAVLLGLLAVTSSTRVMAAERQQTPTVWSTLITPEQLHARIGNPELLILDVRGPKEYAEGHIPEAVNLPGIQWRTPPTKNPAKEGPGQQIFRTQDGQVDVARYEALLGEAGVTPEHQIVVYGNHAGKADGSVPVSILLKLGHRSVAFLDGIGLDRWKEAGYSTSKEVKELSPATYHARFDEKRLWSYNQVLENLNNPEVVFVDSRTPDEFAGRDLHGDERGGHIPARYSWTAKAFWTKQRTRPSNLRRQGKSSNREFREIRPSSSIARQGHAAAMRN